MKEFVSNFFSTLLAIVVAVVVLWYAARASLQHQLANYKPSPDWSAEFNKGFNQALKDGGVTK